ncbi:MAG TPA: fatty acid desaturase, partial [Cyclobacteriaceae bacterium]|nr:fatty acid desaturase [Cyclobacteriaceae bacterium]
MSNTTTLRFNTSTGRQFQTELRKRVDSYFKDNHISKNGNLNLYVKTLVMFSAYLVPYFLIVFNVVESKVIWALFSIVMGLGMAGIGMCIMHDANHGSYSKNPAFNKFLGFFSISLIAGNSLNWRIQHNVIHHTYTNVHDHDEDIAPIGFLRFDPHAERKPIHRYQFIYTWFFYGLMTLMWSTVKDFKQVVR